MFGIKLFKDTKTKKIAQNKKYKSSNKKTENSKNVSKNTPKHLPQKKSSTSRTYKIK